jgi:hypothetical protein
MPNPLHPRAKLRMLFPLKAGGSDCRLLSDDQHDEKSNFSAIG